MKYQLMTKKLSAFWITTLVLIIVPSLSLTQVQISIPSFAYDVIYLTDYIKFETQKLAESIPEFSGELANTRNSSITFWLRAEAKIQLIGKPQEDLATVSTDTIPLGPLERITLTSSDLQRGSTGRIKVLPGSAGYSEGAGRKSLEDAITNSGQSTAPVGTYTVIVYAYPPPYTSAPNPSNSVGRASRTITIRNASPDEVIVTLLDPQPGAIVATILPTFSWSSPNPNVKLWVYEKLPVHQSPQEAVTGIPYLAKELAGATTFTYPADAPRRLEQNKTYVWFVETEVSTNRGVVRRRSELSIFRIQTSNPQQQAVEQFFNSLGNVAAGTFATLQGIGWTPSGDLTLDGRRLTREDLNNLITRLTGQNVEFQLRVENVAR